MVQVGKDSFGNDYIENLKQNDISTGKKNFHFFFYFVLTTFFCDLVMGKSSEEQNSYILPWWPDNFSTWRHAPIALDSFFQVPSPDENKTKRLQGLQTSISGNVSQAVDKGKHTAITHTNFF